MVNAYMCQGSAFIFRICKLVRSFGLGFSHFAIPLHELTKKGVKFQWSNQCQDAFDKLEERLVSGAVLAYQKK